MRSVYYWSLPVLIALALVASPAWSKHARGDTGDTHPPASATSGFQLSLTSKGRLGIHAISMTEELRVFFGAPRDAGVLIGRVDSGSPAAKAGLRVGDVVTRVSGKIVADAGDVLSALADKKKGDAVELSVIRNKRTHTLAARLDDDAAAVPRSFDGFLKSPWWRFSWPGVPDSDRMERLERRLDELEKKLRSRR